MDKQKSSHNLFEVYLRLRPPQAGATTTPDKILTIESSEDESQSRAHITLNPPTDRRRAIEKFAFTRVFEEDSSQLDVFHCIDMLPMVEGVLGPQGDEGTDAVVATLGVTGSGKTHTILGSKFERGITQLALDVLFRSIGSNMVDSADIFTVHESLQACDASEALLSAAPHFIESQYPDVGARSRAATPMTPLLEPPNLTAANRPKQVDRSRHFMSLTTASRCKKMVAKQDHKGEGFFSPQPRRNLQRPSGLPQVPDISSVNVSCDGAAEYVVIMSMYEVHNDRIYDLLTPPTKTAATKEFRRRPLLFKSTEQSADRKVVAGLRKVICTTAREAIMVLEAGLQERRVAGTGSNSTSSRSHGFFCFEVKKRARSRRPGPWTGSKLTIVDLAGSERAREAKTAGATLAEAGKINESLMYLGQCLQTQSEAATSSRPNIVPYRQCKLTELLFSNSFPSASANSAAATRRNPQKGVMIVTADPCGDFNATSQILRYSALAREVTVPRIPSITATILANNVPSANPITRHPQHHPRPFVPPGSSGSYRNHTPPGLNPDERATMEIAALEIARLSDEMDQLRLEADHQTEARMMAEAHLLSLEDRMLDLEAIIREECAVEFEEQLHLELARFKATLALEQEKSEEHWDKKVDVLERGLDSMDIDIGGGSMDKENVLIENLEEEVLRLRRENTILKREMSGRSPSRRKPLEERDDFAVSPAGSTSGLAISHPREGVTNLGRKLEKMRFSEDRSSSVGGGGGSPTKKGRRPKKVDAVDG